MDGEFIRDIFSAFGPVSVRRMFGGAGIFVDDLMFALIADEMIYLKVDAENARDFEREDLPPFTYAARNRRVELSYRRMPDRLYDDREELRRWAQASLAAARRAQATSSGRRARAKARTRTRR
ncbi:MAG: TfoX/Sxy family protein [Pseudorhodoplanes sp.]|nr:TfoX/Sxy family protein [Pseudorhodoplanes sp.]